MSRRGVCLGRSLRVSMTLQKRSALNVEPGVDLMENRLLIPLPETFFPLSYLCHSFVVVREGRNE